MATTLSFSFLLLFPFLIFASLILADDFPEVVRDSKGEPVVAGVEYYIVSSIWGAGGGGLTLAPNRNGSCPFDVVQLRSDLCDGLPVIFSNADSESSVIRVSTNVYIAFEFCAFIFCPETTVWKIASFDESIEKYLVTTGGDKRNQNEALKSRFRIKRAGLGYTFSFSPLKICPLAPGTPLCKDIGIYGDDNGVRRLALTDDHPFNFIIVKKT